MALNIGGVLQQLILPPGGFIFLSILGLMLMRRHQRLGLYMAGSGLGLLYLVSMPFTADILMSWLEPDAALSQNFITEKLVQPPQAIVILGAGRRYHSPEFVGDTPNAFALERIRYGVWVARRSLLPVLVTGGLGGEYLSEAELMKQLIESEYALPVSWMEKQSKTTFENAKYSAEILKVEGINSIYLVTHAFHMKRSIMSFEKFGITVHPAPTAFGGSSNRDTQLSHFLPSAKALNRTTQVFHEWVGMLWYSIRY